MKKPNIVMVGGSCVDCHFNESEGRWEKTAKEFIDGKWVTTAHEFMDEDPMGGMLGFAGPSPERVRDVITEEMIDGAMNYHWLSFADPELPTGTQFLGAAIIKAQGLAHAVKRATELGINPGGEVQGVEFEKYGDDQREVPDKWLNRLLSREDVTAFDADMES